MLKFTSWSLCLILTLAAGCGATDDEPQEQPVVIITTDDVQEEVEPADEEVEPQPADEEVEPQPADEDVEPKPEPEPEPATQLRIASGSWWEEGLDCNSACEDREWACEDMEEENVGWATYTNTTRSDTGSFTTRETVDFETCATPITETIDEYGTIYDLEGFSCSCRAPAITKIDVDLDNLVSCDNACAAQDLVCEPETPWTLGQESGGEAQYRGSDSSRYIPIGCGGPPQRQISRSGREYTLVGFECGCVSE